MGLTPFSDEQLQRIHDSGVEHVYPSEADASDSSAGSGFASGPQLQVEHLLDRGARKIVFAGSTDPRVQDLVAQRRQLAAETLKTFGGGN